MIYYSNGIELAPMIIAYSLAFIALFIGSVTDLKTREVPDWLNYGLIVSGICLNLMFSIIYSTYYFIINSIIGLSIFFGLAYIMFYSGQWGGGDSKMMMGLGAMIGIDVSFRTSQFLAGFFTNALFIGALYGLLWSFYLVLKNRQKFSKEFVNLLKEKNILIAKKVILLVSVILLLAFFIVKGYLKIFILSFAFLILLTFYLWIFVKAIEKIAMYKLVEPSKLTEGDWIANNIYVDGKYICGPKDLGIDKKQIGKLVEFRKSGKVKRVLVKEGIPFVPSFFVAFIFTILFGSVLTWIL